MDIQTLKDECLAAHTGYVVAQVRMLDAAQKVCAEIQAAKHAGLTDRLNELHTLAWLCNMGNNHEQ